MQKDKDFLMKVFLQLRIEFKLLVNQCFVGHC